MATSRLQVDGETAWELGHFLPVLWPWFFEPAAITESRRLHSTVFEAADRFHRQAARTEVLPWAREITGLFEEVRAEQFFRSLGCSPDAILSLDLATLERARPYNHERASDAWERFFAACAAGDGKGAGEAWESAVLSPLMLTGSGTRDAMALAARAEEFHLPRSERAKALVWLLAGRPVSRAAHALTFEWIERAKLLPMVTAGGKGRWWSRGG